MENILNFTNIDKEDFVGMYTAEEIPVKAGETRAFTETIAKHIAEMLATKILIREGAKNYLEDPKREKLIKEMLGEVVVAETAKPEGQEPARPEPKEEKPFAGLKKKKK